MGTPLSIYLHIPFCDWKCTYCDFNSYAGLDDLIPAFVQALLKEIEAMSEGMRGRSVQTVFFGGGTPSLLPPDDLTRVMERLRNCFELDDGAEVTLEANPGTVDVQKLAQFREAGINRLSFGVQSFDAAELKFLTRIHNADTARRAYSDARKAGFDNINLDFIFGLPGQTRKSWRKTLDEAIALRPEHLSLYILTVEDNTPLGHDVARGLVAEADPDFVASLYESTCARMADAGYGQYEISNWSLPGRECRHNLVYWRNGEYLGMGPGAHSHIKGRRFSVCKSPQKYIRLMETEGGDFPLEIHEQIQAVSAEDEMADTAWLGLRLNEGLDLQGFERRFGVALGTVYAGAIEACEEHGLLEREGGRLRLTDHGRLLSNEVFARFVNAD